MNIAELEQSLTRQYRFLRVDKNTRHFVHETGRAGAQPRANRRRREQIRSNSAPPRFSNVAVDPNPTYDIRHRRSGVYIA